VSKWRGTGWSAKRGRGHSALAGYWAERGGWASCCAAKLAEGKEGVGSSRAFSFVLLFFFFFFFFRVFSKQFSNQFENILTFSKITQYNKNKCSNMNAQKVAKSYDKF